MGKSLPSTLKLEGGLERAGPVPPEQQLHSRRGLGPTLDKISDFTLRVQEKKEKKKKQQFLCRREPLEARPSCTRVASDPGLSIQPLLKPMLHLQAGDGHRVKGSIILNWKT